MGNIKYICSLDESANNYECLAPLYEHGMRIVRVNTAHPNCNIESLVDNASDLNAKLGVNLEIELDIQGPKLRIVADSDRAIGIKNFYTIGEDFSFSFGDLDKLTPGTFISIRDGRTVLVVIDKGDKKVAVPQGKFNDFYDKSGAYIKGFELNAPYFRDSDEEYIKLALKGGIDYIGASFVRDASDIALLRNHTEGSKIKLIGKIENPSAIENLQAISENSDLLMVARGDLSVTIGKQAIPDVQKRIITQAHSDGKPAVVASNFFQSLRWQEQPTYADRNDFMRAVCDGADYVLFAGETISAKKNAVKYLKAANNCLKGL